MITAGYQIVEYPPAVWNASGDKTILHIDQSPAEPEAKYGPCYELIGDIDASLTALTQALSEHHVDDRRFGKLPTFMREQLWTEPKGGDGAFMMNGQDLEIVGRLQMDVVVLVLEDHEYSYIQFKHNTMPSASLECSFQNPDFVRYAEAFGLRGDRVGDACVPTLVGALEAAFGEPGGAVVVCPVAYGDTFEPDEATRTAIREIMER